MGEGEPAAGASSVAGAGSVAGARSVAGAGSVAGGAAAAVAVGAAAGGLPTVSEVVDAHAQRGKRSTPVDLRSWWNVLGKLARQPDER